jgi:hypothetical protein
MEEQLHIPSPQWPPHFTALRQQTAILLFLNTTRDILAILSLSVTVG